MSDPGTASPVDEPASCGSPLPQALAPWLGPLAAAIYRRAARYRNDAFDRGDRAVARVARPVISVGNLSAGGTGKTPTVQWVVRTLQQAGLRPAIAMRGYRGAIETLDDPAHGSNPATQPATAASHRPVIGAGPARVGAGAAVCTSDEAMEHRLRAPDVPVLVHPDRAAAIRAFLASRPADESPDVVVLDDGFQHRRLHRVFDLVLIDATRPPWHDRPLPWGYLREGLEALGRAHAVAITRLPADQPGRAGAAAAEVLAMCRARLRPWLPAEAVVAGFTHTWTGLRPLPDAGSTTDAGATVAARAPQDRPVAWLAGRRVIVACGIGHPQAFLDQVTAAGADVLAREVRRDHARWSPATLTGLARTASSLQAEAIVCTLKDMVKIAAALHGIVAIDGRAVFPCPVLCPLLEITPAGDDAAAAELQSRLIAVAQRA